MPRRQRQSPRPGTQVVSIHKTRSNVAVYAVLVIGVVAIFRHLFAYDFVDLDDLTYVVENPHVAAGLTFQGIAWAFTQAYEGYWAPLTWLSYMTDAQVAGLRPAAFHFTNVVIHAASACLLFAGLKRMTGAHWSSAFVAALFAVHPLHVESVAWIAERKDVLSTFFFFLAIYAYVRYVERPDVKRYLLVVAAFACGLMAKPMVVTLPVVLLLLDVWPLRRLATAKAAAATPGERSSAAALRLVREKAPLLAMSLIMAGVTVVVQSRAGAVVSLEIASPAMRVANALVSCAAYLGNMLWPADLAAMYPFPRAVPAWHAAGASVLLAAISAVVVRLRRHAPYLLVGWLWYLVTLLPVLGFIQAGPQARADRYTYIAMTGIAIMAVWGVAQISAQVRYRRVVLAATAGAALLVCGALTSQQITYWRDTESVFRRALAVTTDNYVAHRALGSALLRSGKNDEATEHLRRAVAIAPGYADAHSDLGMALLNQNQPAEAVVHLAQAVKLLPNESGLRVNLGSGLNALGQSKEAEAEYREALRLTPASYKARSGLGLALMQQGDLDKARSELTMATRLNPGYAEAYLNLGTVLQRMGLAGDAERAFSQVTRLQPDVADGHIALGTLLARQSRMNEAIAELSIGARLKPGDAELRSNLGIALISAGRLEDGIAQFSEAVRLRPDMPELRSNLDLARSMRAAPTPPAAPAQAPRTTPR